MQHALYSKSLLIRKEQETEEEKAELVNLISLDVANMLNYGNSFHATWGAIFKLIMGMVLLYVKLEYSIFIGIGVGLLLVTVNLKISKLIGLNYHTLLKYKDKRINLIQDIIHGIRQIKYLNWENLLVQKISPIRKKELESLRNIKKLDGCCVFLWAITNCLISAITFIVYKNFSGKSLKSLNIFVTINLFDILVFPLNALPWTALGIRMGRISLARVQEYLDRQEVTPRQVQGITADTPIIDIQKA